MSDHGNRTEGPAPVGPARWACVLIPLLTALAAIVANLVAAHVAPGRRIQDEQIYLDDIGLLTTYGFTPEFLRGLVGPAGPLFQVVYWAAAPVTGLDPPAVRWVSMALTVVVILATAVALRRSGAAAALPRAVQLLVAPMVVVCGGLALTEMPALAAFSWHLPLLQGAGAPAAGRGRRLAFGAAAGLLVGVAVCGRQNFLMAIPALAALVVAGGRRWAGPAAAAAAAAAAIPAALFAVWGGMVPPQTAWVSGLAPAHGLLAFAYAGIVYCLFDVRWLVRHWPVWLALLACSVAANAATGWLDYVPMKTTATNVLGRFTDVYAVVSSGLLAGFGLVFLAHLLRLLWANRSDPVPAYLVAFTGLLLASCARIAHQFSSRYIVLVAPALVVLAALRDRPAAGETWGKAGRLAVGSAIGLSSLCAYYFGG
ncbi:MAG TPA: hypothetical protein VGF55_33375 [Gemmataceae bacterium]|jgi:hypothetical protein